MNTTESKIKIKIYLVCFVQTLVITMVSKINPLNVSIMSDCYLFNAGSLYNGLLSNNNPSSIGLHS